MIIYTDGSCLGNPGPGGWGWVSIEVEDQVEPTHYATGRDTSSTTNNRMELEAVIEAMKYIRSHYPIDTHTIITDSMYVQQGITSWINAWERKGWKNGKGKAIANKDLWIILRGLQKQLPLVTFSWVRGHNGNKWNEYVDGLANAETGVD